MTYRRDLIWGPTFEEMLHPSAIRRDRWEAAQAARQADPLDSANLYNISWRAAGGGICYEVLPSSLTGVEARIVVLYGCSFPSRSHKVGAAYSILLERQLSGQIHPGENTLLFPSTGNFGIGGAWVAGRMGYKSIVVVPSTVSRERFDLLDSYGATIVKTPGRESPHTEIYETSKRIAEGAPGEVVILNQFSSLANYRFHYFVTGNTAVELAQQLAGNGIGRGEISAFVSGMGSGGTIAAGDRVKQVWPSAKLVGLEPLQCPTLYCAGFGSHQIQGIGDGTVTWIHNVGNMDTLVCVDDTSCVKGLQLLTEEHGCRLLHGELGLGEDAIGRLREWIGISGVANVLGAIKAAKYYGFGRDDLLVTVCTDGIDRYRSILDAMSQRLGAMDTAEAKTRLSTIFHGQDTSWIREGTAENRTLWHNLKYYPWVEQQGKSVDELGKLRDPGWWLGQQAMIADQDAALLRVRQ